jgi:hypothetical protein
MERRNAYKILGVKEIQATLERMWCNVKIYSKEIWGEFVDKSNFIQNRGTYGCVVWTR